MSDADLWAGIVAFIMPIVVAAILKENWSEAWKAIGAFVAFVVVAAGTAYFNGQLDPKNFVHDFLIIFNGAIIAFYGIWKPTGVAAWVEKNILP